MIFDYFKIYKKFLNIYMQFIDYYNNYFLKPRYEYYMIDNLKYCYLIILIYSKD